MSIRLLSLDPSEPGVFAFGQEAYGIFALGQLATGVIAIGQLARGVIAIGQLAIGVVAIGQGALGVLYGGGMLAIGGRGFGLALKVLPKVIVERFKRPTLPPLTTAGALLRGGDERGWILARIEDGALEANGARLEVEPSADLEKQLADAIAAGHTHACVTVDAEERAKPQEGGYRDAPPHERVLVGARMQSWREAPPRVRVEGRLTGPLGLALRALGVLALAYAWWLIAGADIFVPLLK